MKFTNLFLVVCIVYLTSYKTASQPVKERQDYATVIVTLLNGDTVHGTTPRLPKRWSDGIFTGSDLSRKIEVKTNKSWKTKIYKPDDIKSYQLIFPNGRVSVFYSSSTNDFIPIKKFPWGNFGISRKAAFLYHAAGTKLKDYRRYTNSLSPVGSTPIEETYLVKNDTAYFTFSFSEKKWRQELMEFVKECPVLVERIKNESYKEYHSYLIAKDYDDCVLVK